MDRLKFIESMNGGGFVSSDAQNIIQYFDHIMAAYDVIGSYDDIKVNGTINSPLCMTFNIVLGGHDQVLFILNHIERDLALYGKLFSITPSANKNNLSIQIQQQ